VLFGKLTAGFISSETLLYFIRNTNNSWFRENLIKTLLERIYRRLPKSHSLGGTGPSLMNMEIREKLLMILLTYYYQIRLVMMSVLIILKLILMPL
jgi:hypothetical protein